MTRAKKAPFFDHSLATIASPSGSTPSSQATSIPDHSDQPLTGLPLFTKNIKVALGDLADSIIKKLYDRYGDGQEALQIAANSYLDHPELFQAVRGPGLVTILGVKRHTDQTAPVKKPRLSNEVKVTPIFYGSEDAKWRHYIGTADADCWCTRTVLSPQSVFKNHITLYKQPGVDQPVYVCIIDVGVDNVAHRREVGRLNEDMAQMFGPLIDSGILDMKITPSYLGYGSIMHIGDTFSLSIDCLLNSTAFDPVSSKATAEDQPEQKNDKQPAKKSKGKKSIGGLNSIRLKAMGSLAGSAKDDQEFFYRRTAMFNLFSRVSLNSVGSVKPSPSPNSSTVIDLSDSESHQDNVVQSRSELTLGQLKDLYQTSQSKSFQDELPETCPSGFDLTLRPYQGQGVSWMLHREGEDELIDGTASETEALRRSRDATLNPLWHEYRWPKTPKRLQKNRMNDSDNKMESPSFYANIYDGSCSLKRPTLSTACEGGILADEMGLGKTISTLSLIFKCPGDENAKDYKDKLPYASHTTLLVLPMALLTQWAREFHRANTDKSRTCYVYYGSEITNDLCSLLCDDKHPPLIVFTTYGILQSEWARASRSDSNKGLFSVRFFRVVLDEGHTIRNRSTKTARAAYSLECSKRWLLTGTPIVNRLEDLYSLIKFLRFKPWSDHFLWSRFVTAPFDSGKNLTLAFSLLKSILDPILLRRTKDQHDKDGHLLVQLPSKEVVIESLKFNEREEAIYKWMNDRAVSTFNENFRSGMLLKSYSTILTQILRLRQVCDHVDLIRSKDTGDTGTEEATDDDADMIQSELISRTDREALKMIKELDRKQAESKMSTDEINKVKQNIYELYPKFDDSLECSICTGPIDIKNCLITECGHCFCATCLKAHFDFQENNNNQLEGFEREYSSASSTSTDHSVKVLCPMCRSEIKKTRLFKAMPKSFETSKQQNNDDDEFLTQAPDKTRNYMVRPFDPYGKSSKIDALLAHLEQIKDESPGDHIVVFSQFTSFLDIVEKEIKESDTSFHVFKFDGRLGMDQREEVLTGFRKKLTKGLSILLISLKAGGVGLNLTIASKAFLLDPHWNNAVEFQAIDRLHRVGQKKSVKVIRFIMQDSIEERMLEIQKKKNQLGDALTLNNEERRKKKIEEIEMLFKS